MRPLLVLILVIAALGAFYLATSGESNTDAPGGLEPGIAPAVVEDTPTDTTLAQPAAPPSTGGRQEAEVAIPEPAERTSEGFRNRLTGKVLDEFGAPIADARVVLTKWGRSTFFFTQDDGGWDRSGDRTARTDEEGIYQIDNVPPISGYALVATHADFAATEIGDVDVQERGVFEEPPIVLREGRKISGVITDVGGAVVGGASIVLSPPSMGIDDVEGPETKRTTSENTGSYEIKHVAPGPYTMVVTADGYGRVIQQKVKVGDDVDLELNVELDVAQMIAGRVANISGGVVPDAVVEAFSMPGRGQVSRSQTRTDENGEFRFEDIPKGSYTIMARAQGFDNDRETRIETGSMSVALELSPLPTINGTVVDALTGSPVPKCRIRLRQPGEAGQIAMPVNATPTKSKGKDAAFSIFAPQPGNYVVEAASDDYATCFSEPFSIGKGQSVNDIVVRLTRGGKITGRVVDAQGKGIGGVLIETHDNDWTDDQFMKALGDMYPTNATTRQVRSKNNGEFVIANLTPSSYLLQITHNNYSKTTRRDLRVVETQECQTGDIKLASGAEVTGSVYGPSGAPLAGAVVSLTMQPLVNEFPEHYNAKTNAKGVYRFKHVKPGSYSIKAMRTAEAGADPLSGLSDMKNTSRPIKISEGESYTGIDFTLSAGR